MKNGEAVLSGPSRILIGFVIAGICVRADAADPGLAICLDRGVDPAVVLQAQSIADKIFSRVGVRTKWHGSCPVRRDNPIMIRMSSQTPKSNDPEALARARPFEGVHIVVFYDRVKRAMDNERNLPHLLAYVLVHEITHVIQGTDQHSDFGIMKARWDAEDYRRMANSSIGFTEGDLQLLRAGLALRISGKTNQRSVPAR